MSAPQPLVSIVVPHFGDPAPTLDLLRQLQGQTIAARLQLIVSDDHSPDPFSPVEGVEVVRRMRNGGFGSAVNTGAETARADLLLVLNSDVEVEPDFVEQLIDSAAPYQPAVVSPAVVDPSGDPAWVARRFPTIRHQAVEWLTPLARFRDREWWHRGVGHDVAASQLGGVTDWLIGVALLLRTADFRSVGGFDERFFMNSEEVDLQRRLRERGVPSVALSAPRVVHAGGGSTPSGSRRRWLVASRLVYADKWGHRLPLQVTLGAETMLNLVFNTCRRAAGRDVSPLATAREELTLLRQPGPYGSSSSRQPVR